MGDPRRRSAKPDRPAGQEVSFVFEERGKAPLCRVGRSDEPAQSRWNRCTSRASGFLLQRHAHHAASRFSYGMKHRLKRASEPSRTKQGTQTPARSYRRTRAGSKRYRRKSCTNSRGIWLTGRRPAAVRAPARGPPCARAPRRGGRGPPDRSHVVAGAEELVGDVEGGEHGDFQRVAGRRFASGQPHLLVDVRRQLGDVVRPQDRSGSGSGYRESRRGRRGIP